MDIKKIINEALNKAKIDSSAKPGEFINRIRSKNFVKELRNLLYNECKVSNETIRAFSKYNEENFSEFGLNELLYDILVCETSETLSAKGSKSIRFITNTIWQIESEFANDSSEAIVDFNKLVIGNSQNKLFIGPTVGNNEAFIKPLKDLAKYCNGKTYVALVPYPDEWEKEEKLECRCWVYDNVNWKPI